jgi:hypothetical protein
MSAGQLRFLIKRIHLAGAAVHEQLNRTPGPCLVVPAAVQFGPRLERACQEIGIAE